MPFWRHGLLGTAALAVLLRIMHRLAQARIRLPLRPVKPSATLTPYGCPVPTVVHRRIEPVKPGRLIIVGDLHGTPELFRLLDKLQYNDAVDNLVLAGDLVNKGPVSLAVLDAVPKLGCWAVRGNHDDTVLSAWLGFRSGSQPLNPKYEWVRSMTEEQAAVLLGLPFTVSVPEYGVAVVHAGLVPDVPLEQQDMWAMYKMRNVVFEGEAATQGRGSGSESCPAGVQDTTAAAATVAASGSPPAPTAAPSQAQGGGGGASSSRYRPVEKAKEGGEAWAALWRGPPHVFFGHDARRGLQLHPHATGLDTGCVYGGQLTAAVMPPLEALRESSPGFVEKMRVGTGLGLEDLLAEVVAVAAAETYSPGSTTRPEHVLSAETAA